MIDRNKLFRSGYIYGIRQKSSPYLKIGKSIHDPNQRIVTLQCGNPTPLVLEFYFETFNVDVAEEYAHQVLAKRRTIGEWFYVPFWAKRYVKRQVQLACGKASANLTDTLYTQFKENSELKGHAY